MLIFHVATHADWSGALLEDGYRMSTRGKTLDEVGFIHCSRYYQVDDILKQLYGDYEGRLTLLAINPRRLQSPWRLDDVPGAAMSFPHVYGPINRDAVLAATPITRDDDGSFVYPWFLPAPLATTRLVLRAADDRDWPAYRRTLVDPDVRTFLGGAIGEPEADSRRAEVSSKGCVAVVRGTEVVGFCLLGFYRSGDFELSFSLLPEHQRRGYAREAVSTLTDWVFAIFPHLPRLVAVTQQANDRTVSLLSELNWVEVDHFIEWGEKQVMFAIANPRPV
ncbi:MAG TPA: GNAT family N-acetyltransferase [Nocardioidaceae bacterium]|nr:GNAT family N-acetyltransferase [Nocardioidaceae bacterium]